MGKNTIAAVVFFITSISFFSIEDSYSAGLGNTQIHGYIAQGYLKSSDYNGFVEGTKDGTFQFGEMALTFSTYATEKLHLGMQFLALDFGEIGNDEIIIDWAFGDYHWKDYLGMRAGLVKIPFGFYNETRDVDMLRTNIFLPVSIYSEFYRDVFTRIKGASLYGAVPGGFSYQVLYGNTDLDHDDKFADGIGKEVGGSVDRVTKGDIAIINLLWESLFGLKFGFSYLSLNDVVYHVSAGSTDLKIKAEKMAAMVGSIEYQLGNLILASEYALYQLEFIVDPWNFPIEGEPEGYYASASYRFSSWFTLGVYYSVFNAWRDNHDDAEEYLNQLVLSTRFDISENWILKLEIHKQKGLFYAVNEDGTQPTEEAGDDDDWYLYAAKLSFNF